jgi:hypothetical protein
MPQNAETQRGETGRTVLVRIVARGGDYPQNPVPESTGSAVCYVGPVRELCALVESAHAAIVASGETLAPVESVAVDYDTDPQSPVGTAELTISYADPQAFGDAL